MRKWAVHVNKYSKNKGNLFKLIKINDLFGSFFQKHVVMSNSAASVWITILLQEVTLITRGESRDLSFKVKRKLQVFWTIT